jgi:hypothetical protein
VHRPYVDLVRKEAILASTRVTAALPTNTCIPRPYSQDKCVSIILRQLTIANTLPNPRLDPYDSFSESDYEAEYSRVEDAIETQSQRLCTETSQALDAESSCDAVSSHQDRPRRGALLLLQLADWSEDRAYDEQTYIHCDFKWKLTVNRKRKAVAEETELGLVLAPSAFWTTVLRPELDKLVTTKLPHNRSFRAEDTVVVLSVTQRGESKLVKRFDGLDINWNILENQLKKWSHLLRFGKKLTFDISFN